MKVWIRRLVLIAAVIIAGKLLWDQRARLAPVTNNSFRIQGTWFRWEFNHKGLDAYRFKDRLITKEGIEWGSYILRSNEEIEVTVGTDADVYLLSFPDNETMLWSTVVKGDIVTAVEWRR